MATTTMLGLQSCLSTVTCAHRAVGAADAQAARSSYSCTEAAGLPGLRLSAKSPLRQQLSCQLWPQFSPSITVSEVVALSGAHTVGPSRPDRGGFGKAETKCKAASEKVPATQNVNSILCQNCEGNGAVVCSQCKGDGLNSEDHFGGRFKAGAICWLCRGKKQMLCGNCNGAGFMGGFLNTQDD